jgi:hypothetical protein
MRQLARCALPDHDRIDNAHADDTKPSNRDRCGEA